MHHSIQQLPPGPDQGAAGHSTPPTKEARVRRWNKPVDRTFMTRHTQRA
ncbi:MAG: hypothetical protein Q7U52_13850 [Hydrogenophaga sp.]|nr:hypothetical protein [Hydrogenophaga sp.]